MRSVLVAILALLIASPVNAAPAKAERKQETVDIGNNHFLIFSGEPNGTQYAYTTDMVVIQNGIPHLDPLFTEEYDIDSNSVNIGEGVAFLAENYHFDKAAHTLNYTSYDADRHTRFQFLYLLATDMMTLQQVIMQKEENGKPGQPKTIFKAAK